MEYTVGYIRSQGLECRWTKRRNGAPIIVGKTANGTWAAIDRSMWNRAETVGLSQAFSEHTTLIDIFSVPI